MPKYTTLALIAILTAMGPGAGCANGIEGPASADYKRGERDYRAKRFHEAIESFTAGLRSAPNEVMLLVMRGDSYAQVGALPEAMADFDLAISHDPGNHEIHYLKALALMEAGDFPAAIESYNRAIDLKSDYDAALLNRAWLYRKTGQAAEALADYERLIGRHPSVVMYRFARGSLLIEMGRLEDALVDYEVVLALEPNNAKAFGERGDVYHLLGQDEMAIEDYESSIRSGSKSASVHNNLAALLVERDGVTRADLVRALELAQFALRAVGEDAHAHRRAIYGTLSTAHRMLGNVKEAERFGGLAGDG